MSMCKRSMFFDNEPNKQQLEEEVQKLKDEIAHLNVKLITATAKEFSILSTVEAVECPINYKLVAVTECAKCDYYKNKLSLITIDNNKISNVYCAYIGK